MSQGAGDFAGISALALTGFSSFIGSWALVIGHSPDTYDRLRPTQEERPVSAGPDSGRADWDGHIDGRTLVGADYFLPALHGEPEGPVVPHRSHSGHSWKDHRPSRRSARRESAELQCHSLFG